MNSAKFAILGIIVVVLGIIASQALFIVRQTEQVLVLQFGEIRAEISEPGLNVLMPFVQKVAHYEKRMLSLDPAPELVILSDQKRIIVDAFMRYQIVDLRIFYQAVRTEANFNAQFGQILNASVRGVVGERTMADLLSPTRDELMDRIKTDVSTVALEGFGVEVTDVRIGRSELPPEVSANVFGRMQSEREREASLLRAEGEQESLRIRAEADREKTVILAEAQRQAAILQGEGDASVNQILGDAYGRDREFFDFLRSLETYRATFGDEGTTMVLSPDGEFFRYFRSTQ